jgi:predicted RND superfamily exporter protein
MPQSSRLEAHVVRYTRWVVEHPWLVLLLSALIVGALAAGARNLRFSTDYRVYFGPENPQLLAFDELQNVYAKNDSILMMIEPRDGDAFAPRVLEAVREMTEEAWKLPYTLRVDSVTNFQHTEAEGDDLRVAPLLGSDEEVTPAVAQRIRAIATQETLLLADRSRTP